MAFPYFSKNGEILQNSEATVSVQDLHFQYGFGVYESLRVRNRIVYFVDMHVDRLIESASLIGLEHAFSKEHIINYIKEVSQRNDLESSNIKMLLIGGKTAEESTLYIFPVQPLYPDRKLYHHGASVQTVSYQRFMPNAKTLNMLPSYLFFTKARKSGNYDAVFLDRENSILEGTRTNFFVIKGDTLITPPKELVLEGVIRQTLVKVAQNNGFIIKEEKIPLSSIEDFDGAFLTSTSTKILPLAKIDDFIFPEIPVKLKELMKIYDDFLDTCKGLFDSNKA
jgi:branched-chain amino acid aminotransferase